MTELFPASPRKPRTVWRRDGKRWLLIARGLPVACLMPTPEGWLSDNLQEPSNGWEHVDFLTLAHGKVCLERWWAARHTFMEFERYMAPERFSTERDDDIASL